MSLKQFLKEVEETKWLQAHAWFKFTVEIGLESQLKDSLKKKSPSFDLFFSSGIVGEEKMREVVLNKLKSYLDYENIRYVVTSSKVTYYPNSCPEEGPKDAYYTLHVAGTLKL